MSIEVRTADGIAEVIIDFPPVNALPARGWDDLAAAVTAAGADPGTRAVILAAEGRGFCAGVDIKEMQRTAGHEALLGANRGCFAAFAAVYDCPVPVIAAVHGFCLGGGVGLAGNADIVIAAEDATFGLPEVDRGALGAATHLARLVPQPLMRAMVYTCRTVTARQLLAFGTVLEVVPPGELREAARRRRRRDRGQGPGRHPAGQAVAERHRPGRRQALLPVRAGLHLRAQPGRRRGPGPAGVRGRKARMTRRGWPGGSSPRASTDAGRGRRGAARRHDDRDRRLGIAAQADGAGAGHPAVAADGPHRRVATRAPTSGCWSRPARPRGSSPASPRWTRSRSSRTSGGPGRTGRSS